MKKYIIPKGIFIILVLGFLALYMADSLGYYDYQQQRKATLTAEKIKEFEEDVKNGKALDKENYLNDIEKDYRNKLTNTATNVSQNINKYVKSGIESVFKVIGILVGE